MPAFRVELESASDRLLRSLLLQQDDGPIEYLVRSLGRIPATSAEETEAPSNGAN